MGDTRETLGDMETQKGDIGVHMGDMWETLGEYGRHGRQEKEITGDTRD